MSRKRPRPVKKDANFLAVEESSEEIPEDEIEDSSEHDVAENNGNAAEVVPVELSLKIHDRILHLDFKDYENPVATWLVDSEPEENSDSLRRSIPRKGKEGYRNAFRLLAARDIDGFLDHWIIKRLFEPVYILTRSFGQEYGKEKILSLWKCYWNNNLYVRKLKEFRLRGKCCACHCVRNLRYCFYLHTDDLDDFDFRRFSDQSDGDFNLLGLMGTDCYEIKFTAMLKVVDVCWKLVKYIDSPEFEQLVPDSLETAFERCNAAPADMKEKYGSKPKTTEINLVDH